jgi:hypothetical protein
MQPYVLALIGIAGALLGSAVSLWGQARSASAAARREAETVLARYREPLIAAAFELQSRLYNILELEFLERYLAQGDEDGREYALENTLYVVAQYFGWTEILRREIQFMSFSDSKQSRAVADRLRRVVGRFQDDDPDLGRAFLIWRGEQRAIGELMIQEKDGRTDCMGYGAFLERRDPQFRRWFARLESALPELAADPDVPRVRVVELQHALVDLIHELDPQRLRYSDEILGKVERPIRSSAAIVSGAS